MSRAIVWDDLDKRNFYFYGCTVFLGIRASVYPFNLIKTRLQVQKGKDVYRGTFDALRKLIKTGGIRGLYRGFPVNAVGVVSGQLYVTTYEFAKHKCSHLNLFLQGLLPGAIASIVGQAFTVPNDVLTQRMQIQGMSKSAGTRLHLSLWGVCQEIIKRDGLSGFYRGYFVSMMCQVPTSAFWWASYNVLLQQVGQYVESDSKGHDKLQVQAFCGVLSGCTSAIATNSLDVIRTRIQVGGSRSIVYVTKKLWREDGIGLFYKGLSARTLTMAWSSALIIVGYETVKRLSCKDSPYLLSL